MALYNLDVSQTRKHLSLLSLVLSLTFIACSKGQSSQPTSQITFTTGQHTFALKTMTPTEEGLIGRAEGVQLRIQLDGQTVRGAILRVTPPQKTPGITTSWVAQVPVEQVKLKLIYGKVTSVKLSGEIRMTTQITPASFTGSEPPQTITVEGTALVSHAQKVPSAK